MPTIVVVVMFLGTVVVWTSLAVTVGVFAERRRVATVLRQHEWWVGPGARSEYLRDVLSLDENPLDPSSWREPGRRRE